MKFKKFISRIIGNIIWSFTPPDKIDFIIKKYYQDLWSKTSINQMAVDEWLKKCGNNPDVDSVIITRFIKAFDLVGLINLKDRTEKLKEEIKRNDTVIKMLMHHNYDQAKTIKRLQNKTILFKKNLNRINDIVSNLVRSWK